ncbi:MAG: HEAT repeat domain-containing protein [Acidobacteria bacterium]|nr:HEAT repeat domain-containing protein [Acidobacteriota bacterium]
MQKLGEREPARPVSPIAAAPSLAVQFFLIPLTVVAVIVAIYGGFRMMVADERSPVEYLNEVQNGGRDRRWPAAYELSRLMSDPDVQTQFPDLAPALVRAFVGSDDDDPRIRRYLALAIGRLDPVPADAVATLTDALDDADSETVISVIWALGSLGDASAVPDIAELYQSADPGVRKMAVYALGGLPDDGDDGDDGTSTTLRTALSDPVPDVQWNAAVALAYHGDDRGLTVLRRMLDREYVSREVTASAALQDPATDVMISGLRAVAVLGAASVAADLRSPVEALAGGDESLKVRQAAMQTLEALEAAPFGRNRNVAERQ